MVRPPAASKAAKMTNEETNVSEIINTPAEMAAMASCGGGSEALREPAREEQAKGCGGEGAGQGEPERGDAHPKLVCNLLRKSASGKGGADHGYRDNYCGGDRAPPGLARAVLHALTSPGVARCGSPYSCFVGGLGCF